MEKLRLICLMLCLVACSNNQSTTKNDTTHSFARLPVEVYPFNSIPMQHLKYEEENYFEGVDLPPIVPVRLVTKDQVPHGIRLMKSHYDISMYVKPGDIFVSYHPVVKNKNNPMNVLQKGMPHAGIVVANRQGGRDLFFPQKDGESFLCHLDTSAGWDPSGCVFTGSNHFFRVEQPDSNNKTIVDMTNAVFENWQYDPLFQLDVTDDKSIQKMSNKITDGDQVKLYCSELPFALHSMAQNKLIFKPTTFGESMQQFNLFIKEYGHLFKKPITEKNAVESIVGYFGKFLPSQTILNNTLVKSFVSSALTNPDGLASSMTGIASKPLAGMWNYMDEAKKRGSLVHYVGSYVPGSVKVAILPTDYFETLSDMSKLALSIKEKYAKDFFSVDSPYKHIKIGYEKPGKFQRSINFVLRREIPDFEGDTAESLGATVIDTLDYLVDLDPYTREQSLVTSELFAHTCYYIEYMSGVLSGAGYNLRTNLEDIEDEKQESELKAFSKEFFGDSIRLKLLADKFLCYTAQRIK